MGVEFDNENDFEGLVGSAHSDANVYSFGPTIQYVGLPMTVTLGAQFQLPWAHAHSDEPETVQNGYFTDTECTRIDLRFKMDL